MGQEAGHKAHDQGVGQKRALGRDPGRDPGRELGRDLGRELCSETARAFGHSCQHSHDRKAQAAEILARAEARCRASGARLTPIRRAVLSELLCDHRALGAYDLLERVSQREGRRLSPISIYRALDFLVESAFVHRLSSCNAFIACPHEHEAHEVVAFMICEKCGGVDEMTTPAMMVALASALAGAGFQPNRQMIEMSGICGHCGG